MSYTVTERSTTYSYETPHGNETPHKLPSSLLGNLTDIMANLALDLYPTGRAFNMPKGGYAENLHIALNRSFIRLLNSGFSVLDSSIPDNENFDADDCLLWEYRLGLRTNDLVSVENRRNAILRKMSRGRNVIARQGKDYLEYQLRTAGFDVYVHENGFLEGGEFVYKTPQQVISEAINLTQHGGGIQHGDGTQHGSISVSVIANLSDRNENYNIGEENLWATFFVCGPVLGESAIVPENREIEFRELVLKLKAAHLVCVTIINFV